MKDSEDVSEGIKKYLNEALETQGVSEWINSNNAFPNPWFQPLRFGLYDQRGKVISGPVDRRGEIWLEIEGMIEKPNPSLCVGYLLLTEEKTLLYSSHHSDLANTDGDPGLLEKHVRLRTQIPISLLNNGRYSFELQSDLYRQEWITQPFVDAPQIQMHLEGAFSHSPFWSEKRAGMLAPLLPWELQG